MRQVAETNINQRYMIESVSLGGIELDRMETSKLPITLRDRLKALIGQKCDMAALENLSSEIRRELHFRTVTEHLLKGSTPEQVKVDFDLVRGDTSFDVSVPRVLYTSQEKVTGELDANVGFHQNNLTFGVVSNGDDLIERFTGVAARFDSAPLGPGKVHAGLKFEDYHEQWNAATVAVADGTGLDLYRSRWSVAPQLTFAVAGPVTISVGASFEQMESQSSTIGSQSANAATLDVDYGRKIESATVQQRIEGKYSLRVATRALGSTYAYARHMILFKYEARSGRNVASDEFIGGAIAGQAPLFDRFVLGSSSTLRGWDRFEIAPLGGSRVVHNELTYGYRVGEGTVEAFYDAGALWQSGGEALLRHSFGFGYKQGIFVLATGFPIREGRMEPVFMAGMNY
ncbi:MAG: BamA/TamA family outer membrane protein [Bryobacteraceae bacterium]